MRIPTVAPTSATAVILAASLAMYGSNLFGQAPHVVVDPSAMHPAGVAASPDHVRTKVAREVEAKLDEIADLPLEVSILKLADAIATQLHMPVLMDPAAMRFAEIEPSSIVTFDGKDEPVRTMLRKVLMPLRLTTAIEDEGLVIVPDFTQLTRDGIATDRWVNITEANVETLQSHLNRKVSLNMVERPLTEVVDEIARQIDTRIRINRVSLEEIGLSLDSPVAIAADDVTAESVLNQLLADLGLTYHFQGSVIEIMSNESVQSCLLSRVYFLEGTGAMRGDYRGISDLIQTSIVPDAWEALGGYSTLSGIGDGLSGRPSLLVSTRLSIHKEIESLLRALRETQVGPDPIISPDQRKMLQNMKMMMGGGFGGGMGGGGMGGGGMGGGGVF